MTFLALLIDHLGNLWKNEAAFQIKQRLTCCELTLLGKSLSRNFLPEGHNDGVADKENKFKHQ